MTIGRRQHRFLDINPPGDFGLFLNLKLRKNDWWDYAGRGQIGSLDLGNALPDASADEVAQLAEVIGYGINSLMTYQKKEKEPLILSEEMLSGKDNSQVNSLVRDKKILEDIIAGVVQIHSVVDYKQKMESTDDRRIEPGDTYNAADVTEDISDMLRESHESKYNKVIADVHDKSKKLRELMTEYIESPAALMQTFIDEGLDSGQILENANKLRRAAYNLMEVMRKIQKGDPTGYFRRAREEMQKMMPTPALPLSIAEPELDTPRNITQDLNPELLKFVSKALYTENMVGRYGNN